MNLVIISKFSNLSKLPKKPMAKSKKKPSQATRFFWLLERQLHSCEYRARERWAVDVARVAVLVAVEVALI